jgi:hypothetical protein
MTSREQLHRTSPLLWRRWRFIRFRLAIAEQLARRGGIVTLFISPTRDQQV